MFDFEKLEVYAKAKEYNQAVSKFLTGSKIDKVTNDQLRRSSFSIMLNIAQGSGKYAKPDKHNCYVISRGSVYECIAIFDYLKDLKKVDGKTFDQFYASSEDLSKMLFGLMRSLKK